MVHRYHSLYPLEDITKDRMSRVFGVLTFCYKAVNINDGKSYVLRKVDNLRMNADYAMQATEVWKAIQHPGVIGLKEIFVSPAFNNVNCTHSLLHAALLLRSSSKYAMFELT
jgi:PAB-dependent poly(A)-specific ribonuclease subunit 3